MNKPSISERPVSETPVDLLDITSAAVYADFDGIHQKFRRLRKEAPVCWIEPDNIRPFWAVTKAAEKTTNEGVDRGRCDSAGLEGRVQRSPLRRDPRAAHGAPAARREARRGGQDHAHASEGGPQTPDDSEVKRATEDRTRHVVWTVEDRGVQDRRRSHAWGPSTSPRVRSRQDRRARHRDIRRAALGPVCHVAFSEP